MPLATQNQIDIPISGHETSITIFIHGIVNVTPHLSCKNIYLFSIDDILDTIYAHTIHHIREDSFFYINDGMGPLGFTKLNMFDITKGLTANTTAYLYNEISRLSGLEYTNNHYYTYGWSGLFSIKERYKESEALLLGIHNLVKKYTQNGIKPKVRIIGYSHGGNVSLNLAAMHANKYPDLDIVIDELILVGMPVQNETDILTRSPLFKKIYHFYSRLDRIQQIDPFSTHRLFSGKKFKDRSDFIVPDKITQIQVKCSRIRTCKHNKEKLIKHACNNKTGQRRSMRDASPGHIELWFFQWAIGNYRDTFPLAPLPVLVFIPYMISALQEIEDQIKNPYPIIFEMRPECGVSIIKQSISDSHITIPFIEDADLAPLQEIARSIQADDYTEENYQEHLQKAFDKACDDYNVRKKHTMRPSKKAHRRKLRGKSHSGFTML
jgi:hypothetical protein